ncbi:MAG: hypothetical protein ACK5XN_06520, partial [Bacteroidota bacterium]
MEARGLFYTVCEPKSVDGSVESIKVETSAEAKSDKSRQEDSATTLHLLFESLEDDLAADMDSEDITTALDLWKKLSERFEKLLVPNIRAKYVELMTMKLNSGGDMAEYLQKRARICAQLKASGESVSESVMIASTLVGLPVEYTALKNHLEGTPDLTFATLKTRLLNEAAQRAVASATAFQPEVGQADALLPSRTKPMHQRGGSNFVPREKSRIFTCFECGKPGHKANQCKSRRT